MIYLPIRISDEPYSQFPFSKDTQGIFNQIVLKISIPISAVRSDHTDVIDYYRKCCPYLGCYSHNVMPSNLLQVPVIFHKFPAISNFTLYLLHAGKLFSSIAHA